MMLSHCIIRILCKAKRIANAKKNGIYVRGCWFSIDFIRILLPSKWPVRLNLDLQKHLEECPWYAWLGWRWSSNLRWYTGLICIHISVQVTTQWCLLSKSYHLGSKKNTSSVRHVAAFEIACLTYVNCTAYSLWREATQRGFGWSDIKTFSISQWHTRLWWYKVALIKWPEFLF